jgi:hypothetical protein
MYLDVGMVKINASFVFLKENSHLNLEQWTSSKLPNQETDNQISILKGSCVTRHIEGDVLRYGNGDIIESVLQ